MPEDRHSFLGSTSVTDAVWDDQSSTLAVTFHNGMTYTYGDVDKDEWQSFKNSFSPGRFVHEVLKGREI